MVIFINLVEIVSLMFIGILCIFIISDIYNKKIKNRQVNKSKKKLKKDVDRLSIDLGRLSHQLDLSLETYGILCNYDMGVKVDNCSEIFKEASERLERNPEFIGDDHLLKLFQAGTDLTNYLEEIKPYYEEYGSYVYTDVHRKIKAVLSTLVESIRTNSDALKDRESKIIAASADASYRKYTKDTFE